MQYTIGRTDTQNRLIWKQKIKKEQETVRTVDFIIQMAVLIIKLQLELECQYTEHNYSLHLKIFVRSANDNSKVIYFSLSIKISNFFHKLQELKDMTVSNEY